MQTVHLKAAGIACVADEVAASVYHITRGVTPFVVIAYAEKDAEEAVDAHLAGTSKTPSSQEQQPDLL
jgi:hypothetical protein